MKIKKKVINTLEEIALFAMYACIFVRVFFILNWSQSMNELIREKLRRLKGLPTKKVSTEGIMILNDDQAENALKFELSKLDAFQRKVKEMSDHHD